MEQDSSDNDGQLQKQNLEDNRMVIRIQVNVNNFSSLFK